MKTMLHSLDCTFSSNSYQLYCNCFKDLAEQRKKEQDDKKKAEEQRKAELAELFKPIITQQKVPFGKMI